MSDFKVGDLVRLRNPWGPVMTVTWAQPIALDTPPIYHLRWFDADCRLRKATMNGDVLEMAPG